MLGIPDRHDLQILYCRVLHSRILNGLGAFPYAHIQSSNWPLNDALWGAELIHKLIASKLSPMAMTERSRD
jgi:hypothetical protein